MDAWREEGTNEGMKHTTCTSVLPDHSHSMDAWRGGGTNEGLKHTTSALPDPAHIHQARHSTSLQVLPRRDEAPGSGVQVSDYCLNDTEKDALKTLS